MTYPPIHLPAGVEQQAIKTIDAMNERGFKHPRNITAQCKSIAIVILGKWNDADKRMIRCLTNRMVAHVMDSWEKA
jgi:hypothetical protein